MPSEEDKANELLGKIRKEASNKICANCNNVSRLGFGAVCTKYNTFVCDLCKVSCILLRINITYTYFYKNILHIHVFFWPVVFVHF